VKETSMSENEEPASGTPKRTRRPRYAKLMEEIMAEWQKEKEARGDQPAQKKWSFPPPTEVDRYGFPINGGRGVEMDNNPNVPGDQSRLRWPR
jgi:hypothetical protein